MAYNGITNKHSNDMKEEIYKAFFKEMLEDSQGLGTSEVNEFIDELFN